MVEPFFVALHAERLFLRTAEQRRWIKNLGLRQVLSGNTHFQRYMLETGKCGCGDQV